MIQGLPPHFIDLVQDALLKSFWTKKALRTFIRRSHISESFLVHEGWHGNGFTRCLRATE